MKVGVERLVSDSQRPTLTHPPTLAGLYTWGLMVQELKQRTVEVMEARRMITEHVQSVVETMYQERNQDPSLTEYCQMASVAVMD